PLNEIYIEPLFRPERAGTEQGDRSASDSDRLTVRDVVDTCFRTVVLGDPGAGKSTLARKITNDLSEGTFGSPGCRLVPFLVPLRRYEEAKRDERCTIVEHMGRSIREDYQVDPPDGMIEYLLLTGRAFVIFDGLDELLETHRRREVVQAVESFCSLYSAAPVLVTSRRVGYWEAPLSPGAFTAIGLLGFGHYDVQQYVVNWFNLDDTLAARDRARLAEAFITESETIRDLRSNALMLSLLC